APLPTLVPYTTLFRSGATQLVVDEAGMLDQEAARALLELADRYEADVAMIGDRAQLSAVGRGGVLDAAARVATHYVTSSNNALRSEEHTSELQSRFDL